MGLVELIAGFGGWSWVVIGLGLLGIELLVPGGVFIWLGVAAVLVGIVSLQFAMSWPVQFLMFLALSFGSVFVWRATRKAISVMAPIFRQLPNQVRISGHTASGASYANPRYGSWDLSTDRANVVRSILTEFGFPDHQYHSVVGKGENDPLFPNDPYLASNRRISILIMNEEPPVPRELRP